MVGETVLYDIARADSSGMQDAPETPPIAVNATGFINWAWRLEHMGKPRNRSGNISSERRVRGLGLAQFRLAQHWQAGQISGAGDLSRIDIRKAFGVTRQLLGTSDLLRQGLRQIS